MTGYSILTYTPFVRAQIDEVLLPGLADLKTSKFFTSSRRLISRVVWRSRRSNEIKQNS